MSATTDASVAVRRFGLAPKPGDMKMIAADPRGYVMAALARKEAARIDDAALQPSDATLAALNAARKEQKQIAAESKGKGELLAKQNLVAQLRRSTFTAESVARIERARMTETPLLERLVMFWSNHFCISAAKGDLSALSGIYEREAIRPYVLGRFADMLLAVEQHPGMLIYLDNQSSTGPNSKAGRNRRIGLNENLAREILELHTLGVDGGYTQADVTSLARLITGWTVGTVKQDGAEPGRFFFAVNRNEPGNHTVVGKTYASGSAKGGEQCLADLARHPSTARHIARKLASHFVSSTPPPELVARLEKTFRDTDGDLLEVTKALVSADIAWSAPARKILPPYDFAVALLRSFAITPADGEIVRVSTVLGQPFWAPPSPKGFPDEDEAWMGPSSLRERLRVAEKAAVEVSHAYDPRGAAQDLLGPSLSRATELAIARAETRAQGFELLMMSPEFLRR